MGDAHQVERKTVEISFDNHRFGLVCDGTARAVETEKGRSFMKERALRRVEVFGLSIAENPAAKGDEPPFAVPYGKRQAVTETVVGVFARVRLDRQSRLDDHPLGMAPSEMFEQLPPIVGRETEAEITPGLLAVATPFEF